MRLSLLSYLLWLPLLWLGCSQAPTEAPPYKAQPGPKAFVVGMLGESGLYGLINVQTNKLLSAKGPVSNDAVARYWNGYIFVINRLTHDNVQVMNTQDYSLVNQYSVGPKTNPQDIEILNKKKAYISRLGSSKLLIAEPLSGKKLGEVDLGFLAETNNQSCTSNQDCESRVCIEKKCAEDRLPELAQMHRHKNQLWVLAQRLNRNRGFQSQSAGNIAIVDTNSEKVVKVLQTQAGNPYQMQAVDGTLYLSQPGNWMKGTKVVLDGVLEKFDLKAQKSLGVVLREEQLGGNLSSFVIVSPTKAYAIRTGNNWQTELVTFNPSNGKVGEVIMKSECLNVSACYTLFSMSYHPSGKLYIVDRNPQKPGVRILDTSTNREVTQTPLNIGLPPMSVVFYE